MAQCLADLTKLSEFDGTRVPEASPGGPCLTFFGPLLTHSQCVTFPWPPLRNALHQYFASTPPSLDPQKINSGWAGLSLILTSFKRLEVVEDEHENQEVIQWLNAIKVATIRRSLAFEALESSFAGVLQNVLANLLEPIPAQELASYPRTRCVFHPVPCPFLHHHQTTRFVAHDQLLMIPGGQITIEN
ncbi:hypothetical protein T439DRAFT_201263 [Meredithblackwellia eburnea MCA 4105]